jgi:hypothetical protein
MEILEHGPKRMRSVTSIGGVEVGSHGSGGGRIEQVLVIPNIVPRLSGRGG